MPTSLRDGGAVNDARLDRLVQHDDRNLQFLAAAPLRAEGKKPRSYTWRVRQTGNQGVQGACVGFSFTHELVARPKEWDFTEGTRMMPSTAVERYAQSVYYDAQRIDPWPGGEYPGASPQMAGTSILAGVKTLHRRGVIGGYRWAYTVDDLALAVGSSGPAVIGVAWYDGMFNTDDKGFIHPTGRVAGGHAILVHGVSQRGEFFKLTNSWGASWGDGGECKLSFADMETLLRQDGEACIPEKRVFQRDAPASV